MTLLVFLLAAPGLNQGRAAYERGDLAAAAELLDAAVRADPSCASCLVYLGLIAEDRQAGDGRPFFERALALDPRAPTTYRYYSESLLAAGDLDAAQRALERALAIDASYAAPHYLLGGLALRRGDRTRAEREYRAHIALDPRSGAHHDLGDLALAAGEHASARREYAADLVLHPDCYEARINLAALALGAGDAAAAAREYRASLGYHPADPHALAGLGRAQRALRWARLYGVTRASWPWAAALVAAGLSLLLWRRRGRP